MKTLFVVLSAYLSLPALAAFSPVGEFVRPHDIAFLSYDKKGCLEDKGRWQGGEDDGFCVMSAEDSFTVAADGDAFRVTIDTVTTNAHMCSFEGSGKLVAERELRVTAPSDRWVDGVNGKEGHLEPTTCELKISYADDNTGSVSLVSDRDACSSFCGMNAGLEIAGAKRK